VGREIVVIQTVEREESCEVPFSQLYLTPLGKGREEERERRR
jgi:hypothetical protein